MQEFTRGTLLYEGKAKKVFSVNESKDFVWLEFKNSLTAFNAQKKGEFLGKGECNSQISSFLFQQLEKSGIPTHWVQAVSPTEWVCKKVEIIPLEVVVRNRVAGSLSQKFKREEGEILKQPLIEFYYKNDELQDPFVSDDQALLFGYAKSQNEINELKNLARHTNRILLDIFDQARFILIDFKIEFGRWSEGSKDYKILLADEISPDSCRLWDKATLEKFDKDRFRRDLGAVDKAYFEVRERLYSLPSLIGDAE